MGTFGAAQRLISMGFYINEKKKKKEKKMKIPHLNCRNTKTVCLFSPVNFSFQFNS